LSTGLHLGSNPGLGEPSLLVELHTFTLAPTTPTSLRLRRSIRQDGGAPEQNIFF